MKKLSYKFTATPQTTTYYVNETVSSSLYNGAIITLLENDSNITSKASISITITDSNGNTVSSIDNTRPNTYTITYKASYGSYNGTCSNKIIIKEKEVTPPVEDNSGNNEGNN